MSVVILFSGGKESLLCLDLIRKKHKEVLLLYFSYGVSSECSEKAALYHYAEKYNCTTRVVSLTQFAHVPYELRVGKSTSKTNYVPHRNLMFVAIACHIAESVGMGNVCIGALEQSDYVDAKPSTWKKFNEDMLNSSTVKVIYPLEKHTDEQVVVDLVQRKVDLTYLWSCEKKGYYGSKHCGKCCKCRNIKKVLGKSKNRWVKKYLKIIFE